LNKDEFAKEMSRDKTWGNEYTVKSLALAMDLKINVFQQVERNQIQSFRVLSYNSLSDCELNLLYNSSHFEALLPESEDWKQNGENSPQSIPPSSNSDPESKRKGKFNATAAAAKNEKSGAKRAKTKSNIPSFQDWYNNKNENCKPS
jgi:hypothetical protein